MARLLLFAVGALLALWLLGALVQGILLSTSLMAHKIWLFGWRWERFAYGLVIGFVLGYAAALMLGRRRTAA